MWFLQGIAQITIACSFFARIRVFCRKKAIYEGELNYEIIFGLL